MKTELLAATFLFCAFGSAQEPVSLLTAAPSQIAVSSTVDNAKIRPEHLVDGKLETAWNSRSGDLVGAWIEVQVAPGATIDEVKLTPGFSSVDKKLGDLFTQNVRVKKVRVTLGRTLVGDFALNIEDRSPQSLKIDKPANGALKISVLEVVAGTKKNWREVCVSELDVLGRLAKPGKPSKPQVGVGYLGAPPALNRGECIRAQFPDGLSGDAVVADEQMGLTRDITICRTDHGEKSAKRESVTSEVAAVDRATKKVLGKPISTTLDVENHLEQMGEQHEDSVVVTLLDFTEREVIVRLDAIQQSSTVMSSTRIRQSTLYRVNRNEGLVPIFTWKSVWDGDEEERTEACELRDFAVGSAPPRQLVFDCVHEQSHHHAEPPETRETTHDERVEKVAWSGSEYASGR